MDLRRLSVTPIAAALAAGCVHTLEIEVPPAPSVDIGGDTVAVVAVDRECRAVADALVARLHELDGVSVDPNAPVRLLVTSCGRSLRPVIDVELEGGSDRRRVAVDGRAHAVVAVSAGDAVQAHVIGSGRHQVQGAWGDTNVLALREAVARELDRDLARDLALQVSPMPRLVQRRVYPNAAEGSARGLYNDAVHAELRGDLREARRLAQLALLQDAPPGTAAYLQELERLIYAAPSRSTAP